MKYILLESKIREVFKVSMSAFYAKDRVIAIKDFFSYEGAMFFICEDKNSEIKEQASFSGKLLVCPYQAAQECEKVV